jgi:hypothetical protein
MYPIFLQDNYAHSIEYNSLKYLQTYVITKGVIHIAVCRYHMRVLSNTVL